MKLNSPSLFADSLIEHAVKPGFGSMQKRDLELLIYFLLERDGVVGRSAKTYDVATMLNVPLAKAKSYRRDAHARWRGPFGVAPKSNMPEVLRILLSQRALDDAEKHAGRLVRLDGYIPLWVEHPIDRVDFEQAILDAGGIPRKDHHPDVLFVRFDVLTKIAVEYLPATDVNVAIKALKKLAPTSEGVKELLKKNLTTITWADIRSVVNDLGAQAANGAAVAKIGDLFKVLFTTLGQ